MIRSAEHRSQGGVKFGQLKGSSSRNIWSTDPDIIIGRTSHWADIITLGGHQQLEWTSFWVDTTRGRWSSSCKDSNRGGRHVSSRVIKRVTQHLSVQVTRSLEKTSVLVSLAKKRAGRTSLIVGTFPNPEVATGDAVRTAIESYCKSRRIAFERNRDK